MQNIKEFDKKVTKFCRDMFDKHPLFDKWMTRIGYGAMLALAIIGTGTLYIITNYNEKTVENQIAALAAAIIGIFFCMMFVLAMAFDGIQKRLRRLEAKKGDNLER